MKTNLPSSIHVLLHGERPSVIDVVLVYTVGVAAAVFIVERTATGDPQLSTLQMAVLFVLALDVIGGVVANSTRATNRWYQQRPLHMRLLFVAVHFIHPLLAVVVLDTGNWRFFAITYTYVLVAASCVLLLSRSASQRPVAFALYIVGIVAAGYVLNPASSLVWFTPAYFAKLIVCFAVDQEGLRKLPPKQGRAFVKQAEDSHA